MYEIAPSWTLGIDASQANQEKKTGVGQVAYSLIQELKKIIPVHVRVVLYSPTPLSGELAELPPNWSSRVLTWPWGKFWSQIRLAWEMLFRPPDLLFSLTHLLPWTAPERTVCVVHDIGFERLDALYDDRDIRLRNALFTDAMFRLLARIFAPGYRLSEQDYHRWAMRRALRKATRFIAVSRFTRDEMLAAYGVRTDCIDVIHWGMEKEAFPERVAEERIQGLLQRYSIRAPFLLFVGRLEIKKNILRLLECFALLRHRYHIPHHLVLAGMPGHGYEAIRSIICHRNIERFVVETGWFPQKDLPVLMNAADLFVFPSLYEGFGLPILEAHCAGIPLACSDIPVMREVADGGAVFFDPYDPDDMAEKIHTLLTDGRLRRTCLEQGRKNLERFTWEKTARSYWKVLSKELEAGRPDGKIRT